MAKAKKRSEWYIQILKPMMVREHDSQIHHCRTPADAADLLPHYGSLDVETFSVILLNAKNNVINIDPVSVGLVDASLVHPREIFRTAVTQGASAVVLVHNHPSGNPTPSAEDIRVTKQLVEAGKILDIKVIDHVIIGQKTDASHGYLSMREEGLVAF